MTLKSSLLMILPTMILPSFRSQALPGNARSEALRHESGVTQGTGK
jgi:hypothetical protein